MVSAAPVGGVAGQPLLHVAAVHRGDAPALALAVFDRFRQHQPIKAGQLSGLPASSAAVEDRPRQPAPLLAHRPERQAVDTVEVAAVDGDQGLLLAGQLAEAAQPLHAIAAVERAQLQGHLAGIEAHAIDQHLPGADPADAALQLQSLVLQSHQARITLRGWGRSGGCCGWGAVL